MPVRVSQVCSITGVSVTTSKGSIRICLVALPHGPTDDHPGAEASTRPIGSTHKSVADCRTALHGRLSSLWAETSSPTFHAYLIVRPVIPTGIDCESPSLSSYQPARRQWFNRSTGWSAPEDEICPSSRRMSSVYKGCRIFVSEVGVKSTNERRHRPGHKPVDFRTCHPLNEVCAEVNVGRGR